MARRKNRYRDNQDQRAQELIARPQADALQEIEVTAQKITLYSESKDPRDVKDGTQGSIELENEVRNYRYPLSLTRAYPAHITFKAIKIDGIDFSEVFKTLGGATVDAVSSLFDRNRRNTRQSAPDSQDTSTADKEVTDEQKATAASRIAQLGTELKSYENIQGGTLQGSVMLPLQQNLMFQDGVTYNEADLGIAGSALSTVAQGNNPFEGIMGGNGQLTRAAAGIATATVAKNIGSLIGLAAGSPGGLTGSAIGAIAGSGLGEGLGATVRNASRVTTNPNQRTLFEKVKLRYFTFTFKMVANNEKEAQEIKNIVKFFRQEVYPELITVNETPLAYEFPNVFEIEIKNHLNEEPAPKIQRCYLESVQTVYNATANSMHVDGNFVEVDVTLNFKEIVALDKGKVRDKDY